MFIAQNEMAEKAGSVWTKGKRCSERLDIPDNPDNPEIPEIPGKLLLKEEIRIEK